MQVAMRVASKMEKNQDWRSKMAELPFPLVCKCGFNTMDAQEAIEHIKKRHPEEWIEIEEESDEKTSGS